MPVNPANLGVTRVVTTMDDMHTDVNTTLGGISQLLEIWSVTPVRQKDGNGVTVLIVYETQ
jgi:tagatose-1,6-bisphosphate aldolase